MIFERKNWTLVVLCQIVTVPQFQTFTLQCCFVTCCMALENFDKNLQNKNKLLFKGIVSRDFGGMQMILMDRIGVPDIPLEVYSLKKFCFHIVI